MKEWVHASHGGIARMIFWVSGKHETRDLGHSHVKSGWGPHHSLYLGDTRENVHTLMPLPVDFLLYQEMVNR